MNFPDVKPNDIVYFGSGAEGGDWKAMLVTRLLYRSVSHRESPKDPWVTACVPYAVEGIVWSKDGPNVTAYGKDVVYPKGCDDLKDDPGRYAYVQADPSARTGVFVLGDRHAELAQMRQDILQLKEALESVTA